MATIRWCPIYPSHGTFNNPCDFPIRKNGAHHICHICHAVPLGWQLDQTAMRLDASATNLGTGQGSLMLAIDWKLAPSEFSEKRISSSQKTTRINTFGNCSCIEMFFLELLKKSLPGLRSLSLPESTDDKIFKTFMSRAVAKKNIKKRNKSSDLASWLPFWRPVKSFSLRFRRWRMIVLQAKVRKLTISAVSTVSMSRRDEQVFCCFPLVLFQIVSKLLHVASTCFTNLFSPFLFSFTGSVWVFFSETRLVFDMARHDSWTWSAISKKWCVLSTPRESFLKASVIGRSTQFFRSHNASPWKHSQCTKFGYEKMEPAGSSTQHPSPAYAFGVCTRATHSLGVSGPLGQTAQLIWVWDLRVSSGIFDSTESPQSEHIST